jgi:tetratricopeptide (TPR) repeat protein
MNDLRRWAVLFLALALVGMPLVGCASKGAEPEEETAPVDEAPPPEGSVDARMDDLTDEASILRDKQAVLVESYLERGDGLYERGMWVEAQKAYAMARELDPDNAEAREKLARVERDLGMRLGELDDALQDARTRRIVKIQQARVQVETLWNRGQEAEQDGRYDDAVQAYERAILIQGLYGAEVDFTPNMAGLKQQIAMAEERKREAEKARIAREIEEARKIKEAEAERERKELAAKILMLMNDANVAFENQRYEETENFATEILRLDPRNSQAVRLRDLARRSRLASESDAIKRRNAEEWRRTFAAFKRATLPQVRDVIFPDDWNERHGGAAGAADAGVGSALSAKDQAVVNVLDTTRVNLSFDANHIQDAISFLIDMTRLNIVLDPKVRDAKDDSELELTITVDGIAAKNALDLVTELVGLKWKLENGVVFITTEEGFRAKPVLRLYDVRDLVTPIRDFAGEEINLTPSGAGGFGDEEDFGEDPVAPFETDGIVDLIRENVDPESWEADGVSITPTQTGTLIVRQSPDVHGLIGQLLRDLRAGGGLQVSIETRFLTVSDNFLQDIGVDLRGLGDQSGGSGEPGRGDFNPFDDLFVGSQSNPSGRARGVNIDPSSIGTDNTSGVFYNDNSDGDVRARLENLFDVTLGTPGVLTNSGGTSMQFTYLDDTQIEAVLRAVEKSERTEVVVAPKLTVYDGERANVTVLNQISYIYDFDVEIAQAAQIGDPLIQTIRDGVVLDVRPIISASRKYITMELRPTVATLRRPIATYQTTLANGPPVTIQLPELKIQRVRTTVTMPDNGTLLLGGLKYYEEQDMRSTAPWIEKIPIISFFFKREGRFIQKQNLLILIKAKIIDLEEFEPGFGPRD